MSSSVPGGSDSLPVRRSEATPGSPAYGEGPVAGDVHALGERCLDEH